MRRWTVGTLAIGVAVAFASLSEAAMVGLQWRDMSDREAGYLVERAAGREAPFQVVGVTPPDAEEYHDGDVVDGAEFCYRIVAFNRGGESTPSPVACVLTRVPVYPPDAPEAPTDINTIINPGW